MLEIGHLLRAIRTQAWAIDPAAVRPMVDTIVMLGTGAEDAKKLTPSQDQRLRSRGDVALIPIEGPMFHRASPLFERFFGITSTERVAREVRAAAADSTFSSILLHIDSPGGSIVGLEEAAAEIRAAREIKPVIAIADPMAASAAFWLGSQATEFVVTTQGEVGSIGVLVIHMDQSKMMEQAGIDVSIIHAGKHKIEGNPFEPLTDEAREFLQSRVDEAHDDFVAAVAKGRGLAEKIVRGEGFGQGRVVEARAALRAKMVDRIATFNETVTRFVGSRHNDDRDRERRATLARTRAASA